MRMYGQTTRLRRITFSGNCNRFSPKDYWLRKRQTGIMQTTMQRHKSFGAVSAGHLFEKICLWLVPLSDKTITPNPLSPEHRGASSLGDIHLPQMQILGPLLEEASKLARRVFVSAADL